MVPEQSRLRPRVKSLPRRRPIHIAGHGRIILHRQESDGSWWDYPLYDYHQPYGGGYALMALS